MVVIEHAKSGRGRCQRCSSLIEKDRLKVKCWKREPGAEYYDTFFVHLKCWRPLYPVDDVSRVTGYDKLTEDGKERLAQWATTSKHRKGLRPRPRSSHDKEGEEERPSYVECAQRLVDFRFGEEERFNSSHFGNLPLEILIHLSLFLSDQDLTALSSTCHSLHSMLLSADVWKTRSDSRFPACDIPTAMVESIFIITRQKLLATAKEKEDEKEEETDVVEEEEEEKEKEEEEEDDVLCDPSESAKLVYLLLVKRACAGCGMFVRSTDAAGLTPGVTLLPPTNGVACWRCIKQVVGGSAIKAIFGTAEDRRRRTRGSRVSAADQQREDEEKAKLIAHNVSTRKRRREQAVEEVEKRLRVTTEEAELAILDGRTAIANWVDRGQGTLAAALKRVPKPYPPPEEKEGCPGGCGFFGSETSGGYCSTCAP